MQHTNKRTKEILQLMHRLGNEGAEDPDYFVFPLCLISSERIKRKEGELNLESFVGSFLVWC